MEKHQGKLNLSSKAPFKFQLIFLIIFICGCASTNRIPSNEAIFLTLLRMGKDEFYKDYDQQDFYKSAKYLEEAEKINPESQEVHYYLAYTYERLARRDGSEIPNSILEYNMKSSKQFKRVIEIDPIYKGEILISDPYTKLTSIWGAMGMAYLTRGQIDSAIWAFTFGKSVGGFNAALLEYNKNIMQSCERDAILITNGDNDTFPMWYLQLIEKFRQDITVINLSLLNCKWYIMQIKEDYPFGPNNVYLNISDQQIDSLEIQYWEADTVEISLGDDSLYSEDKMKWYLKPTILDNYIRIQDIMLIFIIQSYIGERPIYFSMTVAQENLIGLNDYLRGDGLVFRLLSYKTEYFSKNMLYRNCFENYTYQDAQDKQHLYSPDVNDLYQNYRRCFFILVNIYYEDGDLYTAKKCIDMMNDNIPENVIPYTDEEFKNIVIEFSNELKK